MKKIRPRETKILQVLVYNQIGGGAFGNIKKLVYYFYIKQIMLSACNAVRKLILPIMSKREEYRSKENMACTYI